MSNFACKTAFMLAAIFLCLGINATAQLGSTNLGDLQVKVTSIYRSGDSRDLDCSIGFTIAGKQNKQVVSLSRIKILEAVDDTGKNLIRTNREILSDDNVRPFSMSSQFVHGLKAPDPAAKTIKRLKAEVDLFTRTDIPVTFTNFMSRPEEMLPNPVLEKYQVKIGYIPQTNDEPPGSLVIDNQANKKISLNIDDPHGKIVNLAFTKLNAKVLPSHQDQQLLDGINTVRTYSFFETPPHDLNLVVNLASSETTNRVRFSLENIKLPWVNLPHFEVSVESTSLYAGQGTNPSSGSLTLSFVGGPLTNALGIRNLLISQMEDDSGQPVKVRWVVERFSALPPIGVFSGSGRDVKKFILLEFQFPAPKAIRVLKGEAELVCPGASDNYVVTIKDFISRAGRPFDLPLLKSNHVQLACLGPVNCAAIRQEFLKTNYVSESGALSLKEFPSTNSNSLLFTVDDPDAVLIAPWGNSELNFVDAKGQPVLATSVINSGRFRVYRFKMLPPPETRLRVYLALPESLQRVPFKIKNIPLR